MIGLLRGTVVMRSADGEIIVDVAGVGYRVTVTPSTAAALVLAGSSTEATLFIHTHVREDAIVLYGFVHDDERRCFEVLLGSHGSVRLSLWRSWRSSRRRRCRPQCSKMTSTTCVHRPRRRPEYRGSSPHPSSRAAWTCPISRSRSSRRRSAEGEERRGPHVPRPAAASSELG